MTRRRMFTGRPKVWTVGSKAITGVEFSRKATTQGATSRHKASMSEGLAQGPCVAARVGCEPATFRTEGTEHHHSTTTSLIR